MIRMATPEDAAAIAAIYNHYICNTVITFEEKILSTESMAQRIKDVGLENLPWLVVEEGGQLLGYAYASRWKLRDAYRYTLEVSVYIAEDCVGKGMGKHLYQTLFGILKKQGIHTVIGCICIPNAPSVALHEKLGFQQVAHFNQIGFKFNQWLDIGYWQLML